MKTNMTTHAARKISERRIEVWPDYEDGTAIVFNCKSRRRSIVMPHQEAMALCECWREEEALELLDPQ